MHYIINQPKPCSRLIPLFSIVTLLLLLITTFFPLQISSVHADSTNLSRSITWHEPTVELNIQNPHLNTSLAPKQNGTFSNIATNIEINVTQSSGYQIYLQSENNFLVGQSPDNSTNIPSITETQLPSEFAPNTWGYSFAKGTHTFSDYTTFEPIPTSETIVASSSTSESTTYTLIFGAKIDQTIPADTYSSKVLLSLVAKPLKVTLGLDAMAEQDLPMQSMTKQFCQEAQTGETVRLKDLRGDGKGNEQYYWVTKLTDGNCWMTQNLALDLSTNGLSTSSGSNVNWNASSTYPPENTVTAISD